MSDILFELSDRWIVSHRGGKNEVNPYIPYAWLVEKERTASGTIEDAATIFLTNKECPFHCLMCDLWQNTTDARVPAGAIPAQIAYALNRLPKAPIVKLYNSGSFFDPNAIPPEAYPRIAALLKGFKTVIVESHPRFINKACLDFRAMLDGELQVALGLETVHPEILDRLNKSMTLDDFEHAVRFLSEHKMLSRAFILLKPPFMSEEEGVFWAQRSIDYAFRIGIECCVVIPVRAGNGAMDLLHSNGLFSPPSFPSLEAVLEYGIGLHTGRVFADVWDLQLLHHCNECLPLRTERIQRMNLEQHVPDVVSCTCLT
jgi:archaeosine synthase beta-subunit